MNTIKIIIPPKSIILVFAFVVLAWIIYKAIDVILLLFASFIIASALFPITDWLSKRMHRVLAALVIYLIGFIILATILIPLGNVLIQQIQEFIGRLPVYLTEIQDFIERWQVENIILLPSISEILPTVSDIGQNIVTQSIDITMNIFAGLVAAFTLAVIVFFLLIDKTELKEGFLNLFHPQKREQVSYLTKTISQRVGGYVRGQLLLMVIVGILTTIGLLIVGIDFAVLLGLVAAILEIVPIIGPFLSAVPAVIIALAQNPWLVPWTILVYLIVQRIENSFLGPYILSKFLEIHPVIIITALLVAATTLGIIGVILSPAIAAVIYVLVQELYVKRINKES